MLKYRPEIDGIRAIAVLAVIFYHAQIEILENDLFAGGFLGVDIFFVISGYLISSIILIEIQNNNSFSFSFFYERRIRRLVPVLIFIIFAFIPLAWLYLLPSNFIDFAKSILYSLSFIVNFYFFFSSAQYGAEDSYLIPFFHLWSLSIEEQFYILFPIISLLTYKFLKKYFFIIIVIGFFLSLCLSITCSHYYPSLNFFILPTRAWELLCGVILAFLKINYKKENSILILKKITPFIGFILISFSILLYDKQIKNIALYSLIPVVGTCIIIFYANKDDFFTKILSSKFFTSIGLISYSLYLWHYPIFSFARIIKYNQIDNSIYLIEKFFLILLIFVLSIFTYFFIEKPFRIKNKISYKKIIILLLCSYLVLIIFFFRSN